MGPVEREGWSGARATSETRTAVAPLLELELPVSPVPLALQVQVDKRSKGNPVYPDDVLNRHKWLKVL